MKKKTIKELEIEVAELRLDRDKWRSVAIHEHFMQHYPRGSCHCERCIEYDDILKRIKIERELQS